MLAQGPPLVFAAEEVAAPQLGNARLRARGRSCSRCSPGSLGTGRRVRKRRRRSLRRRGARGCRADARNITIGIWQLRSWYVEIAGLSAAFGQTDTSCSMAQLHPKTAEFESRVGACRA